MQFLLSAFYLNLQLEIRTSRKGYDEALMEKFNSA